MKKLLLAIIFSGYIFANMVDGIAIIVNNEPITIFDIVKTSRILNISRQKAAQILIEQKLQDAEIKRLGISVDEFDLEDAIEKFAKERGLSVDELKNIITQKGLSWQEYKENFKKELLKRKFYEHIVSKNLSKPTDEEIYNYYKENIDKFSIPKYVEIIKYISKDKSALEKIKSNPLATVNGVESDSERVDVSKISPKFAYLLQSTKEGSFTPIIPFSDKYLLIFVQKKIGNEPLKFEEVKNGVIADMMNKKREKAIKDYLAKLKAKAKIKIIR